MKKFKQVLKLSGNITILVDELNWVLEIGNKNKRNYFHSLDELCDELFDLRLRLKIIDKAPFKTVQEISKIVGDARKEVRKDIEQLKEVWTEKDRERRRCFEEGDRYG